MTSRSDRWGYLKSAREIKAILSLAVDHKEGKEAKRQELLLHFADGIRSLLERYPCELTVEPYDTEAMSWGPQLTVDIRLKNTEKSAKIWLLVDIHRHYNRVIGGIVGESGEHYTSKLAHPLDLVSLAYYFLISHYVQFKLGVKTRLVEGMNKSSATLLKRFPLYSRLLEGDPLSLESRDDFPLYETNVTRDDFRTHFFDLLPPELTRNIDEWLLLRRGGRG